MSPTAPEPTSLVGASVPPARRPPVLFLGVPMAVNVRDVLRTGAFDVIRESGAEVHLFTPAATEPAFVEEFADERVHIHPLETPRSPRFARIDALNLRVQVALLSLRCDTARIMVDDTLRRSMPARVVRGVLERIGRRGQDRVLAFLRRWVRDTAPELYGPVFERYRPDLVVGTRVLTMSGPRTASSARYLDRHLLLSAARRGVPTMVLVSSWDNLTTSGFFPVEVDRITVWNDTMKAQAVEIHGMDPERVSVTGAPQHDVFARGAYTDRDAFVRRLGLDPSRPLVVYTTGTQGTVPEEPGVVERMIEGLRERSVESVQVLVRVHQLDDLERYRGVTSRDGVVCEQAGRAPQGDYHDRDFDRGALERLSDTLRHADVVVNVASSISIDAAAVGTPVVCIDFDAEDGVPYHRSVRRFYDFTHQRPVVASGGVSRVTDPAALVEAVAAYLERPDLHQEGRERLVREQCNLLDGGSGRRVGQAVVDELRASANRRQA